MNIRDILMELPIRARYLIRDLSRSVTRPDWRTCKSAESTLLKNYVNEVERECARDYYLEQARLLEEDNDGYYERWLLTFYLDRDV